MLDEYTLNGLRFQNKYEGSRTFDLEIDLHYLPADSELTCVQCNKLFDPVF